MTKAVRFRTLSAGPTGVFPAGAVAAVSDEEAEALVGGGFAELVEAPAPEPEAEASEQPPEEQQQGEPETEAEGGETEAATAEPPENAARRPARKRRASS